VRELISGAVPRDGVRSQVAKPLHVLQYDDESRSQDHVTVNGFVSGFRKCHHKRLLNNPVASPPTAPDSLSAVVATRTSLRGYRWRMCRRASTPRPGIANILRSLGVEGIYWEEVKRSCDAGAGDCEISRVIHRAGYSLNL
jgi:hypothetical protein